MQTDTKPLPKMNRKERKIFNAIMQSFPATNPLTAYNHAINGGTNFQFISK